MEFIRYIFRTVLSVFVLFCIAQMLTSCAIPVAPSGGPKDEKAPVIKNITPKKGTVDFVSDKVSIVFNEKIRIENVSKEVLITPSIKPFPLFKATKNVLEITFVKGSLKPNTTYQIQFGKAIRDINEGNIFPDYVYIFSTARYLDTCIISGKIVDALTNESKSNIKVGLYQSQAKDSVVVKESPLYYSVSSGGRFNISYLPKKSYKVFAFEDKNDNNQWELEESFGYLSDSVLALDSAKDIVIQLHPSSKIVSKGKIRIHINEPTFSIGNATGLLMDGAENKKSVFFFQKNKSNDSLLGYLNVVKDFISLKLQSNGKEIDTIIKLGHKEIKEKFNPAFSIGENNYLKGGSFVGIKTNFPLNQINEKLVKYYVNGVAYPMPKFIYINDLHTEMVFQGKWETDDSISFILYPNAMTSVYNQTNKDTILWTGKYNDISAFGSFQFTVRNPKSESLFVELVNKDVVYKSQTFSDTSFNTNLYLRPEKYLLRVIYDVNKNNIFDYGDYFLNKKSERVFEYKEPIIIKGNWEIGGVVIDLEK